MCSRTERHVKTAFSCEPERTWTVLAGVCPCIEACVLEAIGVRGRACPAMLNSSWGVVAAYPNHTCHGGNERALAGWAKIAEGGIDLSSSTAAGQVASEVLEGESLQESLCREGVAADRLVEVHSAESAGKIGAAAPYKRKRGRPKKELLLGVSSCVRSLEGSIRDADGVTVNTCDRKDACLASLCTARGVQQVSLCVEPSTWSPIVVEGLTYCSPCCPALVACVLHGQQTETPMDLDYMSLHKHLIDNPDYHVSSFEVMAEKLGMNRRSVQGKMCRLAAAQVMLQKFHRWHIEKTLACDLGGAAALKVYIDASCYDETPMRATVRTSSSSEGCVERGATLGLTGAEKAIDWLDGSLCVKSQSCKILQVRQSYGMLVEVDKGLVKVIGRAVVPLSVMQRTSADVLLGCFLQHGGPSPLSKQFGLCCRVTCSDKASYNLRCERQMGAMRGGWPHLGTTCEIHATATTYGKTLDGLVPLHVSSMIHAALSLQGASALQLFRRCLRAEVRQRLVILQGCLSKEASEHRCSCLELFHSSGAPHSMVSSMLLSRLPNGDWRHSEQVQHLVTKADAGLSRVELAKVMEAGLCWVFSGCQPHTYERHRWTGADVAVDHLSRMECVNKLFTHTYRRFALVYSKPSVNINLARYQTRDIDQQGGLVGEQASSGGPFDLEARDGASDACDGPLAFIDESTGGKDEGFAEANSKDRKLTLAWLDKSPWTHLVLMKMAVCPLAQYMHAQLHLGSEEFEVMEKSKVAEALLADTGRTTRRKFSITVAAENTLENTFFAEVKRRFKAKHLWNLVDTEDMNVSCRHLAFKLMSRQAALIYELIVTPHVQYPCRLFQALADQEAVQHWRESPACMLDEWSLELRQRYSGHEAEFREMLYLHALQASTNIAHIESRHSAVRRILQSRVHTHNMELSCCSAEFVFQQLRRAKASSLQGAGFTVKTVVQKELMDNSSKMTLMGGMSITNDSHQNTSCVVVSFIAMLSPDSSFFFSCFPIGC
eukprot:3481791-Amphidinium_carterae.2